jgi:hypothetical protein
MTSIELLKEIEAWLCFNTEPSKEETAKLRKSINDHVTEQLNLHNVRNLVCLHQKLQYIPELNKDLCLNCGELI